MTCISIIVLHKSSLCDQQVELMPCKVWQGRPFSQKKRAEKEACVFAFCSRTDGASVIHMHEAGGCQPITLTLAMQLWPWTQWKRMGPVWAVVLRLYPEAGKRDEASWLLYSKLWLRLWRNATLSSNTCLVTCGCMLVNDGWRGGDMRKCHKDTSLSQADALEGSTAFRKGEKEF